MGPSLNLDFNKLKIDQLGFVFKDIEKQAKIMESLYGIPKFAILEQKDLPIKYRGTDTKISLKLALSRFFNTQIELIQRINGDCIYKEFIDSGREGIHHVSFFVDNLDSYIDEFLNHRMIVVQYGHIGKQRLAYFDTEKTFGILFEFQETAKRKK